MTQQVNIELCKGALPARARQVMSGACSRRQAAIRRLKMGDVDYIEAGPFAERKLMERERAGFIQASHAVGVKISSYKDERGYLIVTLKKS